jgi:hypothetical protein
LQAGGQKGMGQNSWRGMMLSHSDKQSVVLKTKDLHCGGERKIVKSKSVGQNWEVARFQ